MASILRKGSRYHLYVSLSLLTLTLTLSLSLSHSHFLILTLIITSLSEFSISLLTQSITPTLTSHSHFSLPLVTSHFPPPPSPSDWHGALLSGSARRWWSPWPPCPWPRGRLPGAPGDRGLISWTHGACGRASAHVSCTVQTCVLV